MSLCSPSPRSCGLAALIELLSATMGVLGCRGVDATVQARRKGSVQAVPISQCRPSVTPAALPTRCTVCEVAGLRSSPTGSRAGGPGGPPPAPQPHGHSSCFAPAKSMQPLADQQPRHVRTVLPARQQGEQACSGSVARCIRLQRPLLPNRAARTGCLPSKATHVCAQMAVPVGS